MIHIAEDNKINLEKLIGTKTTVSPKFYNDIIEACASIITWLEQHYEKNKFWYNLGIRVLSATQLGRKIIGFLNLIIVIMNAKETTNELD
jgi:hypothetical protein